MRTKACYFLLIVSYEEEWLKTSSLQGNGRFYLQMLGEVYSLLDGFINPVHLEIKPWVCHCPAGLHSYHLVVVCKKDWSHGTRWTSWPRPRPRLGSWTWGPWALRALLWFTLFMVSYFSLSCCLTFYSPYNIFLDLALYHVSCWRHSNLVQHWFI